MKHANLLSTLALAVVSHRILWWESGFIVQHVQALGRLLGFEVGA